MSKTGTPTLALAAIVLAATSMAATAGSWPNLPAKKLSQASAFTASSAVTAERRPAAVRDVPSNGAFEFVGGDSGWQLRQHRYAFRASTLVHAADCPLIASAASAASTGPARKSSDPALYALPGA